MNWWLFSLLEKKSLPLQQEWEYSLSSPLCLCFFPHSSAFGTGWKDKTPVGVTVTFPPLPAWFVTLSSLLLAIVLVSQKSNLFKHNLTKKNPSLITAKECEAVGQRGAVLHCTARLPWAGRLCVNHSVGAVLSDKDLPLPSPPALSCTQTPQSSSELSSDFSSPATFQFFLLLLFSGTSLGLSGAELCRFFLFLGGLFSFLPSGSVSSELLVLELLAWEKSLSCPEEEVGSLAGTFLGFFLRLCFPFRALGVSSSEASLSPREESVEVLPCSFFFFFLFLCERFFCFFLWDFLVFFLLWDSRAVCFPRWDLFFPLTAFCSSPSCWSLQTEQEEVNWKPLSDETHFYPICKPEKYWWFYWV